MNTSAGCSRKAHAGWNEFAASAMKSRVTPERALSSLLNLSEYREGETIVSAVLSQTGNVSVIRLDGAIDIAVASELKATLLEALEAGREIEFTLDAATAFDITAFQLLWAAKLESSRAGLKLTVTQELSDAMQGSLAGMGLDGLLVG